MGWIEMKEGSILPKSSSGFINALLGGKKCDCVTLSVGKSLSDSVSDADLDMTLGMEKLQTLAEKKKQMEEARARKPYAKVLFDVPKPTVTSVQETLAREADISFGLLTWRRKHKIKKFVDDKLKPRLAEEALIWEKRKKVHDIRQGELFEVEEENKMAFSLATSFFDSSESIINNRIREVLQYQVSLPYCATTLMRKNTY